MPNLPDPLDVATQDVWGPLLNAAIESLTDGPDTHANRPTTDIVTGSLYMCSDHDTIYRWDGAAWQDYLVLAAGGGGGSSAGIYRGTWSSATYTNLLTYDFNGGTILPFTTTGQGIANYGAIVGTNITPTPPAKMVKLESGDSGFFPELNINKADLPAGTDTLRWWWAVPNADDRCFFQLDGATVETLGDTEAPGWRQQLKAIPGTNPAIKWRFDVGAYGSGAYIALVEALQTSSTVYAVNDLVSYDGSIWSCQVAGTAQTPGAGTGWSRVTNRKDALDPTTPNSKDDEFNGSSTVTWTATPSAATTDINTSRPSHLRVYRATDAGYSGLVQAVPAAYPYTITAKVSGSNMRTNYNRGGGIILGPAAPVAASSMVYVGSVYNDNGSAGGHSAALIGERILTKFDGTFVSQSSPFVFGSGPHYMRVKVNSATSIDTSFSRDGWTWAPWETGFNPGFTPGVMGLAIGAVTTDGLESYFDFFRLS